MRHPVQKRHGKVDPRPQHRPQPPEPLHHIFHRLRHDPDRLEQRHDDQHRQRQQHDTSARKSVHDPTPCHLPHLTANPTARNNCPPQPPAPDPARKGAPNAALNTPIPLTQILSTALPRDRMTLDPAALAELQSSIASEGLRQPIEVWRLTTPTTEGHLYGLISGLRRLTAHQNLARLRGNTDFTTIPAFLRTPRDIPHALATMVAENEVRADTTPYEKARILNEVAEGISPPSTPPSPPCTPPPPAKNAPASAPPPPWPRN